MSPANETDAPGFRRRAREPADAHFRHMDDRRARAGDLLPEACGAAPCRFEVYRADEVRMTALRFAGGDWHWRLCDESGQVLVDAGGYRNERACRSAVAILQDRAARATLEPRARR